MIRSQATRVDLTLMFQNSCTKGPGEGVKEALKGHLKGAKYPRGHPLLDSTYGEANRTDMKKTRLARPSGRPLWGSPTKRTT